MIDRFYPGRDAELRPSTTQELKATMVIGMEIESASGKVRNKGIGDEEEDYALPIYAVRFPVTQVIGAGETCPRMPRGRRHAARPRRLHARPPAGRDHAGEPP